MFDPDSVPGTDVRNRKEKQQRRVHLSVNRHGCNVSRNAIDLTGQDQLAEFPDSATNRTDHPNRTSQQGTLMYFS
jgi:hypothetical protein